MTDEQIVKVLALCSARGCDECPWRDNGIPYEDTCRMELIRIAGDLIERQKAEIERLQNRIVFWREYMDYRPDELKAEAIKRFVERLREYAISDEFGTMVDIDDIDNLIEETIGE